MNPENDLHLQKQQSRRAFICKVAYTAPALLTLSAAPSFAQQGSVAGIGDPGTGDPGTGDPGTGPRTADQFDCGNPLQPIESDIATSMCEAVPDPDTGEFLFQDIIVSQDNVPVELANGNLVGTCDSIFCNAS